MKTIWLNRTVQGIAKNNRVRGVSAFLITACLSWAAASPAAAGNGAIEINQACATGTGCFDGDTPGYPVTIPASGSGQSYRLTSDLLVPAAPGRGISIAFGASDMTLDLNGFAVISAACVGTATACAPATYAEAQRGIEQETSAGNEGRGATVKNGSVIGFAGDGIRLGESAMVREVEVRFNAGYGIAVHDGSIVVDATAEENGLTGVWVCCDAGGGEGALVSRVVARSNGLSGIHVQPSAVISENQTSENVQSGTQANQPSLLIETRAQLNGQNGIDAAGISLVQRNTAYRNNANGIEVGPLGGALLLSNSAYDNGTTEMRIHSLGSGLLKNVAVSVNSTGGDLIEGGTSLGENLCDGSLSCP